jgi:hypothetical protein
LSFCHDNTETERREEYQVCAIHLTTITNDFAIIAELPLYEDMVPNSSRTVADLLDHHKLGAEVVYTMLAMV